jgi:hypothetical protein
VPVKAEAPLLCPSRGVGTHLSPRILAVSSRVFREGAKAAHPKHHLAPGAFPPKSRPRPPSPLCRYSQQEGPRSKEDAASPSVRRRLCRDSGIPPPMRIAPTCAKSPPSPERGRRPSSATTVPPAWLQAVAHCARAVHGSVAPAGVRTCSHTRLLQMRNALHFPYNRTDLSSIQKEVLLTRNVRGTFRTCVKLLTLSSFELLHYTLM